MQKAVTAYADLAPDVVAMPQVIGSPVVAALLDDIERDKMLTFPQAWAASLLGKEAIQVLGTTYDIDIIAAVDFLTRTKGLKKGDTMPATSTSRATTAATPWKAPHGRPSRPA
ncbi:hypothetical protein SHIRM173S_08784 [Streptomyces hirsutus]